MELDLFTYITHEIISLISFVHCVIYTTISWCGEYDSSRRHYSCFGSTWAVHHQTVSNEPLVPTFNNLITNVRVIEPSSQRKHEVAHRLFTSDTVFSTLTQVMRFFHVHICCYLKSTVQRNDGNTRRGSTPVWASLMQPHDHRHVGKWKIKGLR